MIRMICLLIFLCVLCMTMALSASNPSDAFNGLKAFKMGQKLYEKGLYEESANYLWIALIRSQYYNDYDASDVMELFLSTYRMRGKPEEGLLRISKQFISQGHEAEAIEYLNTALSINQNLLEAHLTLASIKSQDPNVRVKHLINALTIDPRGYNTNLQVAQELWDMRAWENSLAYFEQAYALNSSCHLSLSTSIYLRQFICMWGNHGERHKADMEAIELLIRKELDMIDESNSDTTATVTVHPHMALGYNIAPELKLEIAKSHARGEKALVKESGAPIYKHQAVSYRKEVYEPGFRIRVGYVSANIKAKTTVYMAQDIMRFHNRSKYEIHVYATTPNDNAYFIDNAMRGVDWRAKIRDTVEFFHDMSGVGILQLAEKIRNDGIHILLNWDGYSNNGVRPTGLFPMQTAPIQIAHQEYIGTMGADYIQYMISDVVTSPPKLQHLYTEKFIYLPHCFLANSMSYLAPHIEPPTFERLPGSNPGESGCGGPPASFVYCNFNKHLKFRPDTFQSWLEIIQSVNDSVLCLLENPADSIKNIMHFVEIHDPSLMDRVRFQSFLPNPFDNQRRVRDMCHVVLDTPIYNGHTTAADALWAGVPIVVYGNGIDMSGRVGQSIMTTLDIPELIARNQRHYNNIAIDLGLNATKFHSVRNKLISTAYASHPKNPFWDLQSYVRNLEKGYDMVWMNFIQERKPKHMYVMPSDDNFNALKSYTQREGIYDRTDFSHRFYNGVRHSSLYDGLLVELKNSVAHAFLTGVKES